MTRKLLTGSAAALALAFCAFSASAQVDDDQEGPPQRPAATTAGPGQAAAPAPIAWDDKRLQRLDRNLRRIESELSRLKPDKAPPQLIEPDPEVVALQGRVDELSQRVQDQETALTKVNGSLDNLGMAINALKKDDEAAHAAVDALTARITELEGQVKALTPPPPPPAAPVGAAGEGGAAPGAGAAAGADPGQAFQAAVQQMRDGDFGGAAKAFEAYLAAWPDAPNAPEAHYRLAEANWASGDQGPAAQEYATSLKGWPKTDWAPDATVKLAVALQNLGRSPEACLAIGEFRKRYGASAPDTVKARAQALEAKAQCKPAAKPPVRRRRTD